METVSCNKLLSKPQFFHTRCRYTKLPVQPQATVSDNNRSKWKKNKSDCNSSCNNKKSATIMTTTAVGNCCENNCAPQRTMHIRVCMYVCIAHMLLRLPLPTPQKPNFSQQHRSQYAQNNYSSLSPSSPPTVCVCVGVCGCRPEHGTICDRVVSMACWQKYLGIGNAVCRQHKCCQLLSAHNLPPTVVDCLPACLLACSPATDRSYQCWQWCHTFRSVRAFV